MEVLLGACSASTPALKIFLRRVKHWRVGSHWFKFDPWGDNRPRRSIASEEGNVPSEGVSTARSSAEDTGSEPVELQEQVEEVDTTDISKNDEIDIVSCISA